MTSSFEIITPAPSATIESLTGFGYTIETAIADLIDNSITAQAKNIWIDFYWNGEASSITISDDGSGMSEAELTEAMRPGGKNPLHQRDISDLGRFSLGLKTASWSQCRKLSVWSKKTDGDTNSRCWDLDYVGQKNEWVALKDIKDESSETKLSSAGHGTVVKWEKLSSPLFRELASSGQGLTEFNAHIRQVQNYLGMIFHRFIFGTTLTNQNSGPVNIYVNGIITPGWNPFEVSKKVFSTATPLEPLDYLGTRLAIKGYILPHKDKLSDEEYQKGAGPNGWLAQQGFYVFRSDRLLVPGHWLELGRGRAWLKEEQYRLARISIDIPNSLDREWRLDVIKSKATPPPQIKNKLTQLAEKVREDAKRAFVFRGKYGSRPNSPVLTTQPAWEQTMRNNMLVYKVNRKHPLISGIKEKLGGLASDFDSALRLIEESVPVQRIWLDTAESDQNHAIPYEDMDSELIADIKKTYQILIKSMSRDIAIEIIKTTEPFNRFPEQIEKALED